MNDGSVRSLYHLIGLLLQPPSPSIHGMSKMRKSEMSRYLPSSTLMKIEQQAGGGGNEPLPEWHEMPLGHRDYLFISCKRSVKVVF
jgi:hypothetical protein